MAPLIQDTDLSLSGLDEIMYDRDQNDQVDLRKSIHLPLTEIAAIATQKKSVSFGDMHPTYEVMNRYEYTHDELDAVWYNNDEMRKMRQAARSEAKLVDSGLLVEGKGFSIRGLEGKTRKGVLRKRKQRTSAYLSVFFEIDTQMEEGFTDPEAIADAYFTYSDPCQLLAEKLGKQDEIEARKIFAEAEDDNKDINEDWADLVF